MVERGSGGVFEHLVVFPGGVVDTEDGEGGTDGGHRRAALRELAEETGLLALDEGVRAMPDDTAPGDRVEAHRSRLALDSLVLVSRWVTPEMAPARFDTWFYLLAVNGPPEVRINTGELRGHAWVTPEEALRRFETGSWSMILPTITHLRWLSRRVSIPDALAAASGADGRTLIRPILAPDGSLLPVHLPAEDG